MQAVENALDYIVQTLALDVPVMKKEMSQINFRSRCCDAPVGEIQDYNMLIVWLRCLKCWRTLAAREDYYASS